MCVDLYSADIEKGDASIWDPLVRVFHWSLVVAFVTAWATGDELQALHEVTGYTIVGLLVIRLIWGFIGTRHARFSDFVYRPSTVMGHLRDALRFGSETQGHFARAFYDGVDSGDTCCRRGISYSHVLNGSG